MSQKLGFRYLSILHTFCILFALFPVILMQSCAGGNEHAGQVQQKTGVLLVNHGSRSEAWRNTLLALEDSIREDVLQSGHIQGIKTAFMEYNEPSIATRLKEFDNDGYTNVIIVPVFLTVSPHSFDDIPTIVGLKEDPQSMELLKIEKIERYTPRAAIVITPLPDFAEILKANIAGRFKTLSEAPGDEGLVMIAYGDETYTREWSELLTETGEYVCQQAGISDFSFGWCGHIVHYAPDSTTAAIRRVLNKKKTAVVVPVLVAVDEMFQVKIIGDGIVKIDSHDTKVKYKPDAILPDLNVSDWIVNTIAVYADSVKNGKI